MHNHSTWKAQLSFEFMIYIAVSVISLVLAVPLFTRAESTLASVSESAELQNFASSINARLGYQSSAFAVYLPKALCSSTLGNKLTYMNSSYPLGADISANMSYLCHDSGSIAQMRLERLYNGTYLLT